MTTLPPLTPAEVAAMRARLEPFAGQRREQPMQVEEVLQLIASAEVASADFGTEADPNVMPPWPVKFCLDALSAETTRQGGPNTVFGGLAAHVVRVLQTHVLGGAEAVADGAAQQHAAARAIEVGQ